MRPCFCMGIVRFLREKRGCTGIGCIMNAFRASKPAENLI